MFGLTLIQERLVWVAILVVVVVVVISGALYERHEGAVGCVNNVTAANNTEEKKDLVQKGKDQAEVQKEGSDYEAAKKEPVAPPTIITLGVCPSFPRKAVASTPEAGPGTHGTAENRAAPEALPTVQWDPTPIVRIGHDADAQIRGLQQYILNVCKPQ